jgi:hypothetical protein
MNSVLSLSTVVEQRRADRQQAALARRLVRAVEKAGRR